MEDEMGNTLRNCVFGFKCTAKWNDLDRTSNRSIRFCQECQKEVHLCLRDEELAEAIKLNRCVAIEGLHDEHFVGLIKPEGFDDN
jgi:hypothetical protein